MEESATILYLDSSPKSSLLRLRFQETLLEVKYSYIIARALIKNGYYIDFIYNNIPPNMKNSRIIIEKLLETKAYFSEKPRVPNIKIDRKLIIENCSYMCSIGWFASQCDLQLTRECVKLMETVEMIVCCNPTYLKDRDFVMYLLQNGIQCARNTSHRYHSEFNRLLQYYNWPNDRDMVTVVASRYGYLPSRFKNNAELVLLTLKHECHSNMWHNDLLKDETFIRKAIEVNGLFFQYLDEQLKQDKEIAAIALKSNIECIEYIPKSMRRDKDLMLATVQNEKIFKSGKIQYLDQSLFKHKDIVMHVLEYDISLVRHVHPSLFKDKDVLRMVAKKDSYHFPSVSYFREDKDFMMEMLEMGVSFEHVHESIQDMEMVKKALPRMRSFDSYSFIKLELRKERELTILAIHTHPKLFQFIYYEFKSDYEIALCAVSKYALNFNFLNNNLRSDLKIVMTAIKSTPTILQFIDPTIESYDMIVKEAVKADGSVFRYVKDQESFLPQILEVNPHALHCIHNNKDSYLEYALQLDVSVIKFHNYYEKVGFVDRFPGVLNHIQGCFIPAKYYENDELFSQVCLMKDLEVGSTKKIFDQALMLKIYSKHSLSDLATIKKSKYI